MLKHVLQEWVISESGQFDHLKVIVFWVSVVKFWREKNLPSYHCNFLKLCVFVYLYLQPI